MTFAREGLPFILGATSLALLAWLAAAVWGGTWTPLAGGVTVLALFVTYFFRDPPAILPNDPEAVLAPGQGRILDVAEVEEPAYLAGPARRITIFLSIFDVHVQRAPVGGTVGYREYRPGTYAIAWKDKASEDNEQASLGIETPMGRVLVRQIAGMIARRIVTDPQEGAHVERGQRIGLIRFGSRVELFLPIGWNVTVRKGDRVAAGRTVVARRPVTEARTGSETSDAEPPFRLPEDAA